MHRLVIFRFILIVWASVGGVRAEAEKAAGSEETKILLVSASPGKGFHFPYLLSRPTNSTVPFSGFLLVEPNNSGHVSPDFEEHIGAAKALAQTGVGADVARRLNVPLLMPVFPRSEELYTHSLNRPTLEVADARLRRLDLQLRAMIEDARRRLEKSDLKTQPRVLMTGFSASGSFANRFAALHPDALQAVAVGGINGILILPLPSLDGAKLNYPLGVDHLETFLSHAFDAQQWRRVPQFIYMGALDTNDAVQFDDAYSSAERAIIYKHLGERMQPDRWERCQKIYQTEGATVVFRTYPGIGHGTNGKIHAEIAEFFRKAMAGDKTGDP